MINLPELSLLPSIVKNHPIIKGRTIVKVQWERDMVSKIINNNIVQKVPGRFEYLTLTLKDGTTYKFKKNVITDIIVLVT